MGIPRDKAERITRLHSKRDHLLRLRDKAKDTSFWAGVESRATALPPAPRDPAYGLALAAHPAADVLSELGGPDQIFCAWMAEVAEARFIWLIDRVEEEIRNLGGEV